MYMLNFSVIDLKILLCFGFAAGITFFLIPTIVEMANTKSLVATPNKRTSHTSSVPNLGGIAIFIGFIISYLLFLNTASFRNFQFVFAALLMIFFVGFKDDITMINPGKKFFGQIVAAWIVISFGGYRLTSLHGFFGITEMSLSLSYVVTFLAIIGITNCFNLMDGIDGLSAGLGIIASVTFGTWFYLIGDYDWAILAVGLVGSLCSFGFFNVFGHKNKIFMGDTGSLSLGFMIALIAIHFNEENINPANIFYIRSAPAVSIGILLVPIFDTLRVLLTRLIKRESPFMPDKTHIHHYLLELGFSHKSATFTLIGVSLFFIFFSFLLKDRSVLLVLILLLVIAGLASFLTIYMVYRKEKKNQLVHHPLDEIKGI
jgi:UDP-GlcNAc:undecaprenyl-phosphate/decaprenyl-phosphate GlcNAc-1-phosphate transferase